MERTVIFIILSNRHMAGKTNKTKEDLRKINKSE